MDEVQQLDVGWKHPAGKYPHLRAVLQKFVEAYAAAGVTVRAVTTQNEIDADQGGRMPACPWPEEDEERLVAELGPLFESNGTKIWTLDHNYNLFGRALDQPLEAAIQEVREHCGLARIRGKPGDDGQREAKIS